MGGIRNAEVKVAQFGYQESVANYRQTVLSAFQQVEDQLSNLRILAQQGQAVDAAVQDAQRAVQISLNEYQAGTQAYTTVVDGAGDAAERPGDGAGGAAGPAGGQCGADPGPGWRL